MATLAPIRLLLVEDDDADLMFLRQALEEGARFGVDVTPAPLLEDACDLIAADGGFDAILLNLSLPDSPVPYQTFHSVASFVPSIPIVVLADEDDPAFAACLLREGAQDVIVKSAVDAAPLVTAVCHAIERQRFWNGLRGATSSSPAMLPPAPAEDDVLLALIRVAGVSATAPDVETAMLAD